MNTVLAITAVWTAIAILVGLVLAACIHHTRRNTRKEN